MAEPPRRKRRLRIVIAGADTAYRAARSITYSCPLPGLGAVT